jgi:hypothetical protein
VATGWRSDLATVVTTMRTHPSLLISGMIGFALRGGIVFLALPILVLPTSVEVRLLLGGNIDSNGLAPGFFLLVGALSAATLAAAMVVLYLIARCELASFSRFINSAPASGEHLWPAPGRLDDAEQRTLISRLFVIEALALLTILVAALPLAMALGQATYNEVVLPSSADSIYARILNDVLGPLIAWLAAIVLVEVASAVAARRVLASAFRLRGYFRILHHPLRLLAVGLVGWILFIGAMVVIYVGLSACWLAVESVFLSTGLSTDLRELVSALILAVALGAAFAGALFLGGLVSAVRAGLWTLASLR